jgi:3-oxoacyl-[acyl-carrier protein] reductase
MTRRALVTGGSGAIGAAICRALASQGCELIVHGNRHLEAAKAVADSIVAAGGHAHAVAFDVTDSGQTHAALELLLEGEPIQVLVNNAGIHDDAPLPGMRRDQWQRVIDVSLNGFFNVTQPLVMPMVHALGPDHLDLLGHGADRQPWPDQLCRRKGALEAASRCSHASWAAAASP